MSKHVPSCSSVNHPFTLHPVSVHYAHPDLQQKGWVCRCTSVHIPPPSSLPLFSHVPLSLHSPSAASVRW